MRSIPDRFLARHQRRLAASRSPLSERDFVAYFERTGVPSRIATHVWHALQPHVTVPGFTPAPEDELSLVFRIAEEELDDLGLELLNACKCRIPDAKESDSMPPLKTVGDLVLFIAAMSDADSR